jgi:hypothetical protein
MAYNEYTYRMKVVVIPGIIYLILFPVCLIVANNRFPIEPLVFNILLFGVYIVTAVVILFIWALAGTRRLIIDGHSIILSDMLSRRVFDPSNIQRATFFWNRTKKKEIVKIRTHEYSAFLSDLYSPYQRLLADMEKYVFTYNIRTNLRAHTNRTESQPRDNYRDADRHSRGYANK